MASTLSGSAGRKTGMWTADYLGGVKDESNRYYDQGLKNSVGALGNARSSYATGLNNQVNSINTGANDAINRLGGAVDLYRPAYARGEQAGGTLADSLGLNGAEGNARAVSQFQAGPAYQWQVDQATDAAARKASALGIAGSGNTLTALANLGSNLANKEYGGWQDRLTGMSNQGQQAAGAMSGLMSQQAGYDYGRGQSLSNAYGQNASNIAGTYGAEANLYSQDAQNRAGTAQWAGNQIAQAGQNAMQAGQNAAANRMQLGIAGANLGMKLLGGFAGGGFGFGGGGGGTGGLY
jgi:hypothetical protein